MKKNDFLQIKILEEQVITGKIKEARLEIAGLVIDKNMNKLKDVKIISKKRKDVAQMLTVLRQKQLLREIESSRQQDAGKESENDR